MKAALVITSIVGLWLIQNHELPSEADVTPTKVCDVGAFLEGIVFDREGFGYVSDVFGGAIYRFRPGDAPAIWAKSSQPNGHKILDDGTHVVADAGEHAVLRFDAEGRRQAPSVTESEGIPLQAPNDITLDAQGGYYFTDPGTGKVHRVDDEGNVRTVAAGLSAPNGLALSPDGQTLYVTESRSNRIIAFSVIAGRLEEKRTLADFSSEGDFSQRRVLDGMAVDRSGNLYIAFHRLGKVYVLSASGGLLRRFSSGMLSVANVAFSAEHPDQLFVVGSSDFDRTQGTVHRLALPGVRGASDAKHRE